MRRLGVDLVEYKKAKAFYDEHQNRLKDFFARSEISFIQKSHKPYESLALLLAAKEAIFKSADLPWMGAEGFRKIRVLSRSRPVSKLSFIKSKDYVIAECRPRNSRNLS